MQKKQYKLQSRKTSYKSHLQSDYFAGVKRAVKMRDNFSCQLCGVKRLIEIHHISYQVKGLSIVGKELNYLHWLICLCKECHLSVHQDRSHFFNPYNHKKINVEEFKLLKN